LYRAAFTLHTHTAATCTAYKYDMVIRNDNTEHKTPVAATAHVNSQYCYIIDHML